MDWPGAVPAEEMLDGLGETVTVGVISMGAVTVTEPIPEALVYVDELPASGVYAAERLAVPTVSVFAGIVIEALPPLNAVPAEL